LLLGVIQDGGGTMKRASADDAYDARLQAKELIENFKAGFLTTIQAVTMQARGEIDIRQVAFMLRMAYVLDNDQPQQARRILE
jgi:hypothetical protein